MGETIELRQIMRRWPTGVAVLTTGDQTRRHGMTVNSFASISLDPPAVTVTLANSTRSRKLVDEIGYFGISILDETQLEISERFAGKIGESEDRFKGLEVTNGFSGVPLIKDAAAFIECKMIHKIELLNSSLYIGEVLFGAKLADRMPLVYFNRDYHRIAE
jgi:flavin reductase (DIM6/NTAB) family NADH-FMN oxidoreductase RutF